MRIERCRCRWQAAALGVAVVLAALAPRARAEESHRADWLHDAKWGVMFHYCSNWKGLSEPEKWNATIDAFDVKGLAKQLHEAGAGYFIITAKHCGNPIAPNAAYEKKNPGKCPKRDLIMDLADELGKYDIKLMLYYATGMGVPPVPDTAQGSAAVIEEFSKRYGKKVRGWWLDNNVGNAELQKLLADACRAGNPDALVAFSPGRGVRRNSPFDDFTAGNTHAPRSVRCNGRFVDGAQWHMLTYMANNWGGVCKTKGQPRFSTEQVAGMTKGITDKGGVVTWDVPYEIGGLIDPACLGHVKAIGAAVGRKEAPGKEAPAGK